MRQMDRSDAAPATTTRPVAEVLQPVIAALLGPDVRVRFEMWDGSATGPDDAVATVRMTPEAIRRVLWMPNELGLGRAYVAGDLEFEGDVYATIETLRDSTAPNGDAGVVRTLPAVVGAVRELGLLGAPLPPPPEEARLRPRRRHSRRRDADAISHHYDVGNEFYELVLGPSMTYSCARFADPDASLEDAQASKHELICRKLGLHERPGARLLDVGCGWGSMAMHAAARHGASVVGITISREQAEYARRRVADAGLGDHVEIRVQDYRELGDERFDVISSVGMSEHVGHGRLVEYFGHLHRALAAEGRLLNHAISSVGGSTLGRTSFVGRYVFPDGELVDVGRSVLAMEEAGFEIRDVESLREHYATTLRHWVSNLEAHWDRAVELVGLPRTKIWHLYMAGSAVGFEDGGINVHQILGVVPTASGGSGMPRTRRGWERGADETP